MLWDMITLSQLCRPKGYQLVERVGLKPDPEMAHYTTLLRMMCSYPSNSSVALFSECSRRHSTNGIILLCLFSFYQDVHGLVLLLFVRCRVLSRSSACHQPSKVKHLQGHFQVSPVHWQSSPSNLAVSFSSPRVLFSVDSSKSRQSLFPISKTSQLCQSWRGIGSGVLTSCCN